MVSGSRLEATIEWAIDQGAGAHMGIEEPDRETSLGMVDIWHWELECALGEQMGGRVSDAGDGDPGNDAACNFDHHAGLLVDIRVFNLSETAFYTVSGHRLPYPPGKNSNEIPVISEA